MLILKKKWKKDNDTKEEKPITQIDLKPKTIQDPNYVSPQIKEQQTPGQVSYDDIDKKSTSQPIQQTESKPQVMTVPCPLCQWDILEYSNPCPHCGGELKWR